MDNYEINILRRDGNWKKVNPKEILLDTLDKNDTSSKHLNSDIKVDLEDNNLNDFLHNINLVNSIINKLESLEIQKTDLKNQLKKFEDQFKSKKKLADEKIKLMSKEAEMLDKTISIIKNLKNF